MEAILDIVVSDWFLDLELSLDFLSFLSLGDHLGQVKSDDIVVFEGDSRVIFVTGNAEIDDRGTFVLRPVSLKSEVVFVFWGG